MTPGFVDRRTGPVSNLWRKHVSLPAAFRHSRNEEANGMWMFDFLVPSQLGLLVILGFFILTAIVCSVGIHYHLNDPVFATRLQGILRYVGDHSVTLALVFMPLVILFARRNNFLQWITGWSYSRFNIFHKLIARIAFLLGFSHAVAYTVIYIAKLIRCNNEISILLLGNYGNHCGWHHNVSRIVASASFVLRGILVDSYLDGSDLYGRCMGTCGFVQVSVVLPCGPGSVDFRPYDSSDPLTILWFSEGPNYIGCL